MRTHTVIIELPVEVFYEPHPAEKQTRDTPGIPAHIEYCGIVQADSLDRINQIIEKDWESISEEIAESLADAEADAREQAAEARRESREEAELDAKMEAKRESMRGM